jgi:7,8-dihydroneopterin aldolase/epimerase/oxygenase
MDRITLSSMRFESFIGATEEERAFPQLLEIDLVIETDLAAAAASDELADTVDYGSLVAMTERTAEGRRYALLEGLAGALAKGVFEVAPRAAAATVRVRKLAVPLDVSMDWAEVEMRRER